MYVCGCFHVLAIVNNTVVNAGVHIALQYTFFLPFVYIPKSGIAGSILSFWLNIYKPIEGEEMWEWDQELLLMLYIYGA